MNRTIYDTLTKTLCLALVLLGAAACAASNIPDAQPTTGRNPEVAETPDKNETVRGEDDPAVVTLDVGPALHEHRLSAGDELPGNIIIPTTNLNAVPVTAALQAVLTGTDISLSWDTGTLGNRLVTVMNVSGPLPSVVEKICSAARVFCSYRHGALELQEKDTFVVGLPPIAKTASSSGSSLSSSPSSSPSSSSSVPSGGTFGNSSTSFNSPGTNSMVEALSQLVGSKVQVDEQGGNILYTTDVRGEERVSRYLQDLRNGRPLVVLQMYVWEVTLNKENSEGINWNELKLSGLGPGFAKLALDSASAFTSSSGASGSVSLGAVTTGRLNTNSLVSFLSTQGQVQTISNPQITFISGTSAELKVGGEQSYISSVGQLVASNNTSGTSNPNANSGVGTNTVSTSTIDTGLMIDVAGAYENGIVMANLDLNLVDLVSLNPTNSGGETIDLPETTNEKITTVIRVRPGDNLVLAGLVTAADTNSRQGIPLGQDSRLPMYGDEQFKNNELVVVVKPSVILFSDSSGSPSAAVKKKETASALPSPVLIDKDGTNTIALPGTTASAPPAAITADATKPELMQTVPNPQPAGQIPVGASDDAAPVDRRLMQRGFSHAFDELLQPEPGSVTASGPTQ